MLTAALATPISTSTQGNSDTPREAPPADLASAGGHYESRIAGNDFSAVESVWVPDVEPGPVTVLSTSDLHKVSSPELASLAAKYVSMSDAEMRSWTDGNTKRELQERFWADIRRLAASVLSQAAE